MDVLQSSRERMDNIDKLQEEVDRNFQEFQKILPDLLSRESNRWALMRSGECTGFYDTLRDANTAGQMLYEDDLFSVQQVSTTVVDLGWFSHALH